MKEEASVEYQELNGAAGGGCNCPPERITIPVVLTERAFSYRMCWKRLLPIMFLGITIKLNIQQREQSPSKTSSTPKSRLVAELHGIAH